MASWNEFAQAAPALAQAGEGQIFQYGVGLAFLATVRGDGAPRLHTVRPVLSQARLYVLILPDSPKRLDLERDGRYALQAFPQSKPDSDEFYLTGTARRVDDPEIYAQVFVDAQHKASPGEVLFELEVGRAMHTRWEGFETEEYHAVHASWRAEEG